VTGCQKLFAMGKVLSFQSAAVRKFAREGTPTGRQWLMRQNDPQLTDSLEQQRLLVVLEKAAERRPDADEHLQEGGTPTAPQTDAPPEARTLTSPLVPKDSAWNNRARTTVSVTEVANSAQRSSLRRHCSGQQTKPHRSVQSHRPCRLTTAAASMVTRAG
jgi:hypothetical protein